ncbi:plasmid stabilization protein [Aureimonas ureilytica]|uniref:Plasmid stabilization protein n=1 Tax=Aureimonas ureilytica TaxID=401562 RepID=A0A175RBW3_9HYPH|nr:hypothetical protein [Aureimonas ureilytica]KTQ96333.1 plasmid stabilization protein [Aureimonas ureilytica]
MPAVTIRNLPEETHRVLKSRAAQYGHSTKAEMRAILEAAVRPETQLCLRAALFELGRNAGLTDADAEALDGARSSALAEPILLRSSPSTRTSSPKR